MVRENALLYQQDGAFCTTIVDETGMGGRLFRQEFNVIKPLRGYDFGGTKSKKLVLLATLKSLLDKKQLVIPRGQPWDDLRRQLLSYKLNDKKLETDAVMALALAVWHAVRNPDQPVKDPVFSYYGGSD
jgi:hypothetical protein